MAIVVTYDVPTNTIQVTGGTVGTPATFNDIQVANDGGGWGVCSNPFAGCYKSDAHLNIGNGGTPTYFSSQKESIYFNTGVYPKVVANAILRIGLIISGRTYNGSVWFIQNTNSTGGIAQGGIILIYASTIFWEANWGQYDELSNNNANNSVTATDAIFHSTSDWGLRIVGGDWIFNRVLVTSDGSYGQLGVVASPSVVPIDLFVAMRQIQFLTNAITINRLKMVSTVAKLINPWDSNATLVDPQFLGTFPAIQINTDGVWLKLIYTCNIHIADKDGANINGATIACEDQFGTPVFSVNTGADGKIAEQTIIYKQWIDTTETLTTYSPHVFTISKAGYETMVLDAITVDAPIVWHLELLPELAEADVRLATTFGEDKTGALDLPPVNDVEKGVQFDGLTKTGTFKEPGEVNVKNGVGYGANDIEFTGSFAPDFPAEEDVEEGVQYDDLTKTGDFHVPAEGDVEVGVGYGAAGTEFEGTYLGLRGENLTAELEESVDLVGCLEQRVDLTGELRS